MKLEFDIKDIDRDEVVDAMAQHLLRRWSDDDGESPTDLGRSLASAVSDRITKIADEVVRQHFDDTIRARIAAAVDAVLAEGWYESDGYGGRKGERHDLKARINAAMIAPRGDSYNRRPPILQERIDEAIKATLDKDFGPVIAQARETLRKQLDATVMTKVTETVKAALGLR